MKAPLAANESERLNVLYTYQILESTEEKVFNDIVALAAQICGTSVGALSFIDKHRCWNKASLGVLEKSIPRDVSPCAYTLGLNELLEVSDLTSDPRFSESPLVTNSRLKFFAAWPLVTAEGFYLGALYVASEKTQILDALQKQTLKTLAEQCLAIMDLKRKSLRDEDSDLGKIKAVAASKVNFEFIANLSYEIRTAVNGIIGMTEMISESVKDEENTANLKIIERESTQLIAMINNIVDLSRIDTGIMSFEDSDFSPFELVHQVCRDCTELALANEVEIHMSLSPQLSDTYCGDFGRLKQALVNVLKNAILFTKHKEVCLYVGLNEDTQGQISFLISDESTDGFDPEVAVKNFTNAPLAPKSVPAEKQKILIAEDNPVTQLMICKQLEELGYEVTSTSDGEAMLAAFAESRFAAVILDLQMPKLDGLKAAQAIRAREAKAFTQSHVPIIACTAKKHAIANETVRAAGMDGYIVKPASSAALSNALKVAGAHKNEIDALLSDHPQGADRNGFRKLDPVGLELAIGRRILEKMSGSFRFHRSDVTNRFLMSTPARKPENVLSTLKMVTDYSSKKILIVEDNESALQHFNFVLKNWGAQPFFARNAQEAFTQLSQEHSFDCIFINAKLKEDGFTLLEQMQQKSFSTARVVMLLNGMDPEMDLENLKKLGIRHHLQKPFAQEELKALLNIDLGMDLGENDFVPNFGIGAFSLEGSIVDAKKDKILIAEDNEHNRAVIKAFLKNEAFALTFVSTGEDAVELFKKEDFRVVLMDLQMPKMDGYEALRMMRSWEKQQNREALPIIAFTASAATEDRKMALSAGFNDYIVKPIKAKALVELIQNSLMRKNAWPQSA